MKTKILANGTKLSSGDKEFIVDGIISSGTGQGDIYRVHSDGETYALKLFHTGDTKATAIQMKMLRDRGKACDAIIYPLYLLHYGGRVGYVMEYVDSAKYDGAHILFNGYKRDENGNRVEMPFNEKLNVLYNIAGAVDKLFTANIALMDLKFDNIMVSREDRSIKLLDTDTAVVSGDTAMVTGTIGFMPPLTMRGEEQPTRYNDLYALAVMIYRSLLGGHPLIGQAEVAKDYNGKAEQYLFATHPVYVFNDMDRSNACIDSRVRARMTKYPDYFKDAMHRTFVDGLYDGTKRVTASEWMDILVRLYNDHYICACCGEEQFYDSDADNCDNCGAKLNKPISLVCNEVGEGVHLFNGEIINSEQLFNDYADYDVFEVVTNSWDNGFALRNVSKFDAEVTLKNGETKTISHNGIIPIFMDAEIKMRKYTMKFIGGKSNGM